LRNNIGVQRVEIIELTSLEVEMKAVLDEMGIEYVPQFSTRTGFIIDFAIFQDGRKLALEVDGPCHDGSIAKRRDRFRDRLLKAEGWEVVRLGYREMKSRQDIEKAVYEARYGVLRRGSAGVRRGEARRGEAGQGMTRKG